MVTRSRFRTARTESFADREPPVYAEGNVRKCRIGGAALIVASARWLRRIRGADALWVRRARFAGCTRGCLRLCSQRRSASTAGSRWDVIRCSWIPSTTSGGRAGAEPTLGDPQVATFGGHRLGTGVVADGRGPSRLVVHQRRHHQTARARVSRRPLPVTCSGCARSASGTSSSASERVDLSPRWSGSGPDWGATRVIADSGGTLNASSAARRAGRRRRRRHPARARRRLMSAPSRESLNATLHFRGRRPPIPMPSLCGS